MFSCEFCKIFKNTYFVERVAAFDFIDSIDDKSLNLIWIAISDNVYERYLILFRLWFLVAVIL